MIREVSGILVEPYNQTKKELMNFQNLKLKTYF